MDEKYISSLNETMNIKRAEVDNIEKSNELYATVNKTISAMHKLINMKFHTIEHTSDAYDFRELLLIGGVLISSINILFVVLFPNEVVKGSISKQSNLIKVYNSSDCFNQIDYTDKEYYDYMRLLCSIHPTNTDRSSRDKDKIGNNVLFNINWIKRYK